MGMTIKIILAKFASSNGTTQLQIGPRLGTTLKDKQARKNLAILSHFQLTETSLPLVHQSMTALAKLASSNGMAKFGNNLEMILLAKTKGTGLASLSHFQAPDITLPLVQCKMMTMDAILATFAPFFGQLLLGS